MYLLVDIFKNLTLTASKTQLRIVQPYVISVRYIKKEKKSFVTLPIPGMGKAFRRIVHYPEKYTVEPINYTNLGGRDPVTGRKVCEGIGGGIKYPFHWVKFIRLGPKEGPPQEEKVIKIIKSYVRTAHIALVAVGDEMKYILASENMKGGDIIKTSMAIPKNLIRPNEGDAYPLGALPFGTIVHNVQITPESQVTIIHAAGCFGVVKNSVDGKVILQMPSKREMALDPQCMATVGKLSNAEHSSTPIGSAQRNRELGNRPRSGLWKRKTGKYGKKIKKIKPTVSYTIPPPVRECIRCTLPNITF